MPLSSPTDPERNEIGSRLERDAATRAPARYLEAPDGDSPTDEERERSLVLAAKAGDSRAREELIELYLPRIVRLAREYAVPRLELDDLVQEGCVGLLRALVRYDPERGTPFWPYATWWVRNALQDLRSHFLRPLRLPPKALGQLSRIKSSHAELYARDGREPSVAQLAEATGISEDQVEALLRADAATKSLAEPVQGLEGEVGLVGDLIDDPLSSQEYEAILDALAGSQVASLLGRLTERERAIVRARFGFGARPEQLSEIGERLGISAERVRQLEERGLAKLRKAATT